MLEAHELFCERQRRVLFESLSFSATAGELVQIRGGNGSGKTTLLKILTGLYDDYEGELSWDIDEWPLFVGHRPGVKDQLTVLENLTWLARLRDAKVNHRTLIEALSWVGLSGFEKHLCGALSEGQRKRVNLARLYFTHTPAWILDEPFSAIDREGVGLIQSRIEEQLARGGLVIVTSHQEIDASHTRYVDLI